MHALCQPHSDFNTVCLDFLIYIAKCVQPTLLHISLNITFTDYWVVSVRECTQTGLKSIFTQSGTLFLTAIWACHAFLYLPLPRPIFKLSLTFMWLNELASFDFRNDLQAGQVSENKTSDSERTRGILFLDYVAIIIYIYALDLKKIYS